MSAGDAQARSLARIAVALLCAAALVAVVAILGDGGPDGITDKAITVIAVFPLVAFCGLAGLRLIELRPRLAVVGILTIGLGVVAYCAFLQAFWSEGLVGRHETVALFVIGALAAGQASLLLSLGAEYDGPIVNGVLAGSIGALALLTLLTMIEVSDPGPDVSRTPIAICAVLYLLGVVLVPLLRRAEVE